MVEIIKPKEPEPWDDSNRFSGSDEVIAKITSRFPNLRCPVCSSTSFELIDDYENNHRTGVVGYVFPQARPAVVSLMISLNCSDCGYLLSFDEAKLKTFEAPR